MTPEQKTQINRWCDLGFASYDDSYYGKIIELLKDDDTVEGKKVKTLAEAGYTLSSPRFAYPHIQDLVRA